MARFNKHHLEQNIQAGKPRVGPEPHFVTQLQSQLHVQAQQLAQYTAQPKIRRWHTSWFTFGGLASLGAVAVVAAIMIVPSWLNPTTPLTGYIQKGPFISGTAITIQELDERLQPTGTSYQVTTASDFGDYRLSRDIQSRYVEVIAQGYYFNEVAGQLSTAPLTLRAIADTTTTHVVNVNVLTTLMVPRLRHIMVSDEMDFLTAKKITEQEVLSIFQVTGEVETDFEQLNISEDGDSNGLLLAASVLLQGNQSEAELSELLSKLSLAIKKDGQINSEGGLLTKLNDNADDLNVTQITENLTTRYGNLGVTASVPEFANYLEPFINKQ